MDLFIGEVLGTFLLITLGMGVCCNVVLKNTGGFDSGYLVINWGWGIAVFVAVFVTGDISGAHINPAVTIGLAAAGNFDWALVPMYIAGQFIGAILAAVLVWFQYRDHFDATEDKSAKLGVFSTAPSIPNTLNNLYSEIFATFILIIGVLYIAQPEVGLGAISALPVGLLVFGIGMSMGGTTGYAINPARDLGPRIAHALLPIKGKGDSNWGYAWIPVIGPILGSILAAVVYRILPF
ncbi:MAG: aquaporin family protein [Gammaproteobacteria bacterium]|nr:aquaporin family protein [Gammaproteobacteria bacterium]MDD9894924.1 aquaporin family protein [Gammaproteobacteria bacterium]MDD9958820.1 aquaporin family protein [Gammaproteobacteria bacterium]